MTFHDYVRKIANASDEKIAARVDTTSGTVASWKIQQHPNARYVIAFAREYGRPLSEAFMAAYGLTAEELGVPISADPSVLSDDELIDEVARRIRGVEADGQQKMSAAPGEVPASPEPGAAPLAEGPRGRLIRQQQQRSQEQRKKSAKALKNAEDRDL